MGRTEHFASRLKVNAEGIGFLVFGIVAVADIAAALCIKDALRGVECDVLGDRMRRCKFRERVCKWLTGPLAGDMEFNEDKVASKIQETVFNL